MNENSKNQTPDVLLAGDVTGVFVSDDVPQEFPCRRCNDVLDAVGIASSRHFSVIGVAMSGAEANLDSTLKALRRVSGKAKVILLAQMFHEPLAIRFVQPDRRGNRLADDYLICPVVPGDFDKWLGRAATATSQPGVKLDEDLRVAEKIRQLEKLATEDDITGLKNRRYIWEFGRQIIARAAKTSGQVTLLIFDIDDFKQYNDRYGHLAGDDILKQAATLIQRCCRKHDVVGRIGGDEFAVLFWDDPRRREGAERRSSSEHPKEAVFIAERLRSQLENTAFDVLGPAGKGTLTISGGLATFPRDGSRIEELFHKADQALLEAKESGKNRIYLVGRPNAR
jgi:diguanylate cyclase (GGDEF)-like protein